MFLAVRLVGFLFSPVMLVQDQLPSPVPEQLRSHKMFDIEIKYGLLQISEGLAFLHDSAKMLHRNISPEAIVINEAVAGKICGFEYCLANSAGPGQEPSWSFPEYVHGQPPETYPQVDIIAKTLRPVISRKEELKLNAVPPMNYQQDKRMKI